ncbi:hypothetical protein [Streptomyces sp. NPDC001315]|uniref:hypothetical protein n=1 Tax=Streptomyces sp. NPDC001315 TaxID=3364562 RepID=UPI0036A16E33
MGESYPAFLAGQRITASMLASAQPVVARKTADTARAAVATVSPDPHLQFDVVAGGVYTMDGWIKYDGPTAADLLLDFSAPSGTEGEWLGWGVGHSPIISFSTGAAIVTDSQQSRGYPVRVEANDVTSAKSFGCLGVGAALTMVLMSTVRVGPVGGVYSLDWSQQTSDASPVTLFTDSWLRLQRIA